MLSAFNEEKVEFLVVGAYATAAHGMPRSKGTIMMKWGGYLFTAWLALLVMGGCATSGPQSPIVEMPLDSDGFIVSGDDERLVTPEIEEDRQISVVLIAATELDRPEASVKVTRNPGAGAAAFVEVASETSASDVRRAFSTLGLRHARHPDHLDRSRVTYIMPVDHITFRFDDDPFFRQISRAVEEVRAMDAVSRVEGYGEVHALVIQAWISTMIGAARTLDP